MATMKLAFFFFFTLSTHFGANHARHLRDGFTYGSSDPRLSVKKTAEVIQMVTGEQPPPPPSSSTTYGLDNKNAQAVHGGETIYSRSNPKAPPPPKVAPSRGQTTYGGDNPSYGGAGVAKKRLADILALLLPSYDRNAGPFPVYPAPSDKEETYRQDNPNAPPPPKVALYGGDKPNSNNQTTYGGAKKRLAALLLPSYDPTATALSLPNPAPSDKEAIYRQDNPKAPPSPSSKPKSSVDRTAYGRDDPRTPPTPDPNGSQGQGMYGRVDSSTLPNILSKSICGDDGNSCTVDEQRNGFPLVAPAIIYNVETKPDEDEWQSILSYIIKVFNYWG